MALRNIVQDGDPILKKPCRPVASFDEKLGFLLNDMADTMLEKDGLGLAAPQVGILRRIFIALDESSLPDWLKDDEDFEEISDFETLENEEEGEEEEEEKEDYEPVILEFINPEIIEKKGEVKAYEGCLSFPGKFGAISRPTWVKVRAFNRFGQEFIMEADGTLARCICHEIDHLNGVTVDDLAEYFYDPDVPHDLDESITGKKQEKSNEAE